MLFQDRRHAGRCLGERLQHLRDPTPLVLGLPRGGVVVATEVARALGAPLDVLIVRKLGAPAQPELAIGAVVAAARPRTVLNDALVRRLGVSEAYITEEVARQTEVARARRERYVGARTSEPIEAETVIVVDDGVATGATVRAGLAALRDTTKARVVLAVPVAAPQALALLAEEVDEIVCLHAPPRFRSVGEYYACFDQTTDDEVVALIARPSERGKNP